MRFSTGQTIGRYVVEALLGEGGMGEVYRARDSRLERSVALKVLRNQTEEDGDEWNHAVMRMQREAKAVAALSHPTIVAIYDVDEFEGSPYIAMELVSGKSLRELIGTDSTTNQRLRIMLDVARALEVAHKAEIVHRDIKPDNILVREDGTAKVLDFGIARRNSQSVENAARDVNPHGKTLDTAQISMTAEGAIVGTPAYMAPEQLRGDPVDARADQFAWGVVTYELLTGRHPFHAEKGGVTLLASILSDSPEPLTGVPASVAAVVMRTLEKQPEDRWPSMHDVVLQWSAFITGEELAQFSSNPQQPAVVVAHSEAKRAHTSNASNVSNAPNAPNVHRARRAAITAVALGVMGVVAVGVGMRRNEVPNTAAIAVMALSAQPPAGPIVVTDTPVPASESLEARAAFREGLQAIRDARWGTATAALDRARKADPGMAAAHLRFSLVNFTFDIQSSREAYRKAQGLRGALSERDQGLLQAVEPFIMHEPSDYETTATRLEALSARYPNVTELVFWNADVNFKLKTDRGRAKSLALAKECTRLDPKHADCWQVQSWIAKDENRRDDAMAALEQCISASGNAIDCLEDKIEMDALHGRCSVVVDSVRKLTTLDPATPAPRRMLLEALFYSGEPEPVVALAANEAAGIFQRVGRPFEAANQRVFKATAFGDFDTALREMDSMANSQQAPGAYKDVELWLRRAALRKEMDDIQGAAKIADEFFARNALHPLGSETEGPDPTMVMNAIKLAAGTMTKSAYEAARTTWLAHHQGTDLKSRANQWFSAYSAPANNKDLAELALLQLDTLMATWPETNSSTGITSWDRAKGRLLSLAGRPAEAKSYLEKSTNICLQTDSVISYVHNMAWLGMAREATGDPAGACKSYQWVLAHWGKSKQSMTVKEVTKRAKSLACEAPAM